MNIIVPYANPLDHIILEFYTQHISELWIGYASPQKLCFDKK